MFVIFCLFFFFQAEDGIRDHCVTGVQTCALPIYRADRIAVPVLLGLGIRELSVVPAAIPAIKRQIRAVRIADCRALASRCLELATAAEVRSLVAQASITSGEAP